MKLDSIVESGGTLSAKQKADLELYTKKIAEIRGDKTEKDNFSTTLDHQLEKVPLLVDKIELLRKKLSELNNDKGVDSGKYSIVSNLLVDYENQLSSMTTEFINSFQDVEVQKTAIVKKYSAIRASIERRGLSTQETSRLLAELEREKQSEINTVLSAEYAKSTIYERFSQNLMGITKRELAVRIASLEEYQRISKDNLSTEQQKFIESEINRAIAIKATFSIGVEENSLLKEKKD
ncbi:hypothetical protein EVD20_19280 [Elizabethkingia bruuniana]|nr:hypothetical protein [Elizabethkingia bruuniana]QDZ64197.1 hypothetical protein EVD20_19280 [Elizabethkingia bruuniana]